MVGKGFNFRSLFWLTGILAFFISPIADNLTTALLMYCRGPQGSRIKPKNSTNARVNIVIAANNGGAFGLQGTSLAMVWQVAT